MILLRRGFTLIELLVVISIVGILGGVLLSAFYVARQHAHVQRGEAEIVALKSALEQYRTDFGDYPPSTLDRLSGGGSTGNSVNEGNEAMTACLATSRMNGPYYYVSGPDDRRFRNLDGDSGVASWTAWVFPDSDLREIVDPWDNPYIYFNGRDLKAGTTAAYSGQTVLVSPVAGEDQGTFRSALTFQLWSCGPDGVNTEGQGDDITSWNAQRHP